ncbi:MAG TPA: hypothetical protein VHE53_03535 [Patescibacteria group bacterium]|nr:hypothetical protein [Patescibacteria group bacterium]
MPDLLAFNPNTFYLGSYSITVTKGIYATKIKMNCLTPVVNTRQLPSSHKILREELPSIFNSKCFNDQDNPFIEEAKRTELGHLFEHVMLEYICMGKIEKGLKRVSVSGVTDWNWKREPFGTYNITLRVGKIDQTIIDEALKKTITLFDYILKSHALHTKKQKPIS